MDHRKIMKGLVALVMTAVLVVLIMLTVNHVKMGIMTNSQKITLAAYILMMVYASFRIFSNVRDIFRS